MSNTLALESINKLNNCVLESCLEFPDGSRFSCDCLLSVIQIMFLIIIICILIGSWIIITKPEEETKKDGKTIYSKGTEAKPQEDN